MSLGNGNILVQQRQVPGGGGGITGADNGLSVAGGTTVELGGPLIQDTFIDLNNQILLFEDGIIELLRLQPYGAPNVTLGKVNPASGINYIELSNNGNANDSFLFLHQGLGRTLYSSGAGIGIDFEFGDIDAVGNGLKLQLYDVIGAFNLIQNIGGLDKYWQKFDLATGVWDFKTGDIDGVSGSVTYFHIDAQSALAEIFAAGGSVLMADPQTGNYNFGDLAGNYFGSKILMNDSTALFSVERQGKQSFYADYTQEKAWLGDALGNSFAVRVSTDQLNKEIALEARGGLVWIGKTGADITGDFDTTKRKVILGDTSGQGNLTTLVVDDNAQEFQATNMVATGSINDSPLVITSGGQIKKMPAKSGSFLSFRGGGQTLDDTTPVTILVVTPADIAADETDGMVGIITAQRQSDDAAASYNFAACLQNIAGVIGTVPAGGGLNSITVGLNSTGTSLAGSFAWVTNGNNQELQVTGIAGDTLDWTVLLIRNPVTKV